MERALVNVNAFLDGISFDESTIISDVANMFNMGTVEAFETIKKFGYLMCKRRKEVADFIYVLRSRVICFEHQKVLLYKYLPFKDTRCLEAEGLFLAKSLNQNILNYNLMFRWLMEYQEQNDSNLLARIDRFIENEQIDFERFKTDYKIVGVKSNPFPKSDEEIEGEMQSLYQNPNGADDSYSSIVGHYAELIAYRTERMTLNPQYEELIWVSREIGDGFGYDLMRINHLTNTVKLIEVKGTLKGSPEVLLTSNERRVLDETVFNMKVANVSYHVYRLCLSENSYELYDYTFDESGVGRAIKYTPNGSSESGVIKLYELDKKLRLLPGPMGGL